MPLRRRWLVSLTDRLGRLGQLREALDMAATSAPGAGGGDLSDEDARRIREAILRVERGER